MKIVTDCVVIMKGERRGNDTLYILQGSALRAEACSAKDTPDDAKLATTRLWHSRLGHVGQKGLEVLAKEG